MPKFDPTAPVQVQFSSAAFVHVAVAVSPTFKQVMEADAGETRRRARVMVKGISMFAVGVDLWMVRARTAGTMALKYSFYG